MIHTSFLRSVSGKSCKSPSGTPCGAGGLLHAALPPSRDASNDAKAAYKGNPAHTATAILISTCTKAVQQPNEAYFRSIRHRYSGRRVSTLLRFMPIPLPELLSKCKEPAGRIEMPERTEKAKRLPRRLYRGSGTNASNGAAVPFTQQKSNPQLQTAALCDTMYGTTCLTDQIRQNGEHTDMKKRILTISAVTAALAALAFLVLWQSALHRSSEELKAFAQAEAKEAYTCFSDFQKTGLDRDYWSGVASFYAFQRAYGLLTDGTNKSANAIFCNEVYGSLLMAPEQAKAHISEIADTMKLLSENVTDENAYLRMAALRNTLHR